MMGRTAGMLVASLLPLGGLAVVLGAWGSGDSNYQVNVVIEGATQVDGQVKALPGQPLTIGSISLADGKLGIALPELPASGPVTDAFIADRGQAPPERGRVFTFPGPDPNYLDAHVSQAQADTFRAGGYVLVVRTRGTPETTVVGPVRPWPTVSGYHGLRYMPFWKGASLDGDSGASYDNAGLPFDADLNLDEETGRLCISADYSRNHVRRTPVSARLSIMGREAARASVSLTASSDAPFSWGGCLQASPALRAALEAGRAELEIALAAAPAREFVGQLTLAPFVRTRWSPGK